VFRKRKPPPRRITSTKVIRDSNPDFWINPDSDPNICRVAPKCCEFVILSASVISPSVTKIGRLQYEKCQSDTSIPQWSGKWISDPESVSGTKSYLVFPIGRSNHDIKFQRNRLITFEVILHTVRQTKRRDPIIFALAEVIVCNPYNYINNTDIN